MKTFYPKPKDVQKKWYLIDAKGKVLGRVATEAAKLLRGKHKSEFTPHLDCGDEVIVINAKDIVVTGRKLKEKTYTSYSGYPGGLKVKKLEVLMKQNPALVVEHAIWGMLPHNKLGRKIFKKLRVYAGEHHPHMAQKPEVYKFK
jgi:large subunit ribosomal protein L13